MQKRLKILAPLLILSFLIWVILQNWFSIQNRITTANFSLLFLAGLILVLTHLGGAFFWYRILTAISLKVPFKEAFRVFVVSNFGRFIPGVILHYVARVYLSKGIGLNATQGISSVFLEAYYTLVGAVVVSMLSLPIVVTLILARLSISVWVLVAALGTILILVFAVSPNYVFKTATRLPLVGKMIPSITFKRGLPDHLSLICLSSALFILDGVAFFLLSSAFVGNPLERILSLSGLFSAAWIVGFLTPVAPGGLGVSDLSFAFLLTQFYTFSLASFLVLVFRFSLLLTEAFVFLVVIKVSGIDVLSTRRMEAIK